jgi:hypothetical protein
MSSTIPDLIVSFTALLAQLTAAQAQQQTTSAALAVAQTNFETVRYDQTIPVATRSEAKYSLEILQDDAKQQQAGIVDLQNQLTRAAGELRNTIRGQIGAAVHTQMLALTAAIVSDYVVERLPFPPDVIAAQSRSLLPWQVLSTSLDIATRPQDDWNQFVTNAQSAQTALAALP